MGGIVGFRLVADLRRRWRGLLALSLLVAVLGGLVLAAAAGARRTSSAYARLLERVNPPELLVSPPGAPGSDPTPFYAEVVRLPGVRGLRLGAGLPMVPEAGTSSERLAAAFNGVGLIAWLDDANSEIAAPRLIAGRFPDRERADEVMISELFADKTGLDVGDHIDGVLVTEIETDAVGYVATADEGTPVRLTVTGIGVVYDEVVPFGELNASGSVHGTPPLAALVERDDWNFEGAFVDTDPEADLDALIAAIEELGEDNSLGTGGPVFVSSQASVTRQVDDSMQPLAAAIAIAAAVIGVVALLVIGQAMARANREAPEEVEALRALGSRPADRLAFAAGRAAVVGVVGAAGAVALAIVAVELVSPRHRTRGRAGPRCASRRRRPRRGRRGDRSPHGAQRPAVGGAGGASPIAVAQAVPAGDLGGGIGVLSGSGTGCAVRRQRRRFTPGPRRAAHTSP